MDMPRLTDRAALMQRRCRTDPSAFFLHALAADEIDERLIEVNRSFTSIAIVTGAPDFWAARYPDATIIPDDDMLVLQPGAHDLIIHAMCLHWANDPVGQMVQCRHGLQPDGLFFMRQSGRSNLA